MKRWTVMLVPQGLGATRSLEVGSPHVWIISGLVAVLTLSAAAATFSATLFWQKSRAARSEVRELERENRELAQQANSNAAQVREALDDKQLAELERDLRDEYEASTQAIVSELNALWEEEARLRQTRGLPPKDHQVADYVAMNAGPEDGKGGPPGAAGSEADISPRDVLRPPNLIYGLANPSADLIVQEIRLRRNSISQLHEAILADIERDKRMPTEWPIRSSKRVITSHYGWRRDPFSSSIRRHDGTDIAAPYGTSVVAAGKGRVTDSGYEQYYGHVVRIDHGEGYTTAYAHLSSRSVSVGDMVERGDVIGRLGSSGRSTGPHLHYEVRVNGKTTDPEEFLP